MDKGRSIGAGIGTIIIRPDSKKPENPDPDILCGLPDRIAEYTDNKVTDNGYDYLTGTEPAVRLTAANAEKSWGDIVGLLKKEKFCGSDLSATAEIYASCEANADIDKCRKVYPCSYQRLAVSWRYGFAMDFDCRVRVCTCHLNKSAKRIPQTNCYQTIN